MSASRAGDIADGPVVGVVGLGLIGGSVAQGWVGHGPVVAWTRNAETRAAAAEAGITLAGSPGEVAEAADIVVLATPLPVITETLAEVAGAVASRSDAPTVTDVGSVKGEIAAAARRLLADPSVFVPGHPMAGTQHTGWGAADPGLFLRARWALAVDKPTDLGRWAAVAAVACRLGAEVVPVKVAEHDKAVARASHLPYVLAACLQEVVHGDPLAAALAAGSFASATRVVSTAEGAGLGVDLAMANEAALGDALARFAHALDRARTAVAAADEAALREVFLWRADGERVPAPLPWPATRSQLVALGRAGGTISAVRPDLLAATVPEAAADGGPDR